jgi:hypothetical protein
VRPKPDSEPPVTLTSPLVKFVEASDKVNVICVDSPGNKLARDEVTATVGGMDKAMLTELLASLPSSLALAAASVNAPLATLTVPVPVAPLVKVAE